MSGERLIWLDGRIGLVRESENYLQGYDRLPRIIRLCVIPPTRECGVLSVNPTAIHPRRDWYRAAA